MIPHRAIALSHQGRQCHSGLEKSGFCAGGLTTACAHTSPVERLLSYVMFADSAACGATFRLRVAFSPADANQQLCACVSGESLQRAVRPMALRFRRSRQIIDSTGVGTSVNTARWRACAPKCGVNTPVL